MQTPSDPHERLKQALLNPACWPQRPTQVELIETHISSIFLLDGLAYKLKKTLDLGFLDFSSREKRHFYCQEELRLNRRLAPDLYLDVVPLAGSPDAPEPEGTGEPIDWLLKMRRFTNDQVLAEQPETLHSNLIQQITEQIARFHAAAPAVDPQSRYGTPEAVLHPMLENFSQLRGFTDDTTLLTPLDALEDWTRQRFTQLTPLLQERRDQGQVRECHGDLHLANMVLEGERAIIFDGIEFSPALRWLDPLNDLAFLLMDLHQRGRADLARIALDDYLQHSGDFAGLPLLDFYQVYRAMVRAKVSAIRLGQPGLADDQREAIQRECLGYIQLAETFTRPGSAALLITHGLSGSGKSHFARQLPGPLNLVRVRSDVERKRLAGLDATARATAGIGAGLYSPAMSRRTFDRLAEVAVSIVRSGRIALVDATFLHGATRQRFCQLAEQLGVPFLILDFELPRTELEARIQQRRAADEDASDADLEVLASQIANREPLDEAERQHCWHWDPLVSDPLDDLDRRLEQLGIPVTVGRAATA